MKINYTNKQNLPEAVCSALINDEYKYAENSDISVTGLLTPPRIEALRRGSNMIVSQDFSDNIFALIGNAVHYVIEKSDKTGFPETSLQAKINDWNVTGTCDSLYIDRSSDGWSIDDYKTTSVYVLRAYAKGEDSRVYDWMKQINFYAYLAKQMGYKITHGRLVLILRDWSVLEAKRGRLDYYPQHQVATILVPIWPEEQTRDMMTALVENHQTAQQTLDQLGQEKLIECLPSERWDRPDKWAVMKKGRKSALRVVKRESDAHKVIDDHIHTGKNKAEDLSIEYRPGERVRCENYCEVSGICTQYRAYKEALAQETATDVE